MPMSHCTVKVDKSHDKTRDLSVMNIRWVYRIQMYTSSINFIILMMYGYFDKKYVVHVMLILCQNSGWS